MPESCCKADADLEMCQGKKNRDGPPGWIYRGGPVNIHLSMDVSNIDEAILLHVKGERLL